MMGFLFYLTIVLFILVCLFMILLILIQKGRGGGLASAFGGSGGNTAFGSKTGDVLTWATSIVFGVFLLLAVALNLFADARNKANTNPPVAATSSPGPSPTTPTAPIDVPLRPGPAPTTQAATATPSSGTAAGPATVPVISTPPTSAPAPAPSTDAPVEK